uniref:Uncharacterized protein n=1 Tax=Magallana gigas TaxID=29159 RepID=K1PM93_MAGGI
MEKWITRLIKTVFIIKALKRKGKHPLMADLPMKILQANVTKHRKNHGIHLK